MESSGPFGIREALKRQALPGDGELMPPTEIDIDEDGSVSTTSDSEPNRYALFEELRAEARKLKIALPKQYIERFLQLHTRDHTTFTQLEKDELDQILSALRQNVESPDTVESPVPSAEATKPVPEHLQELQNIVATPITAAEVPDKETFMRDRYSWIARALLTAGYDAPTVDRKMAESFTNIQAGQTPEEFVSDITRRLQKLWEETLLDQPSSPRTIPASEVSATHENSPTAEPATIKTEAKQIVTEPVIPITPVLAPERYQLTPDMRVDMVQETVVKEPEKTIESPEGLEVSQQYQQKLDDLNKQPFQRDAYLEYTFNLHTELNTRYSDVVALGRANLKRFDGTYVPSPNEKKALQLLSGLQGHYAKMQRSDSEIGIRRAELMNSLNRTDAATDESAVKTYTQQYLDATKKFFANIDKLEQDIDDAASEENTSVEDTYRELLRQLHEEGQKVLTHLDPAHPYRKQFADLIQTTMADAMKAAAKEADGDRALRERNPYFNAVRDRVRAATDFVKVWSEFDDRRARVEKQLPTLTSRYEQLRELPTSSPHIKEDLGKTMQEIGTIRATPEIISVNTKFDYISPTVFKEATARLITDMENLNGHINLAQQYLQLLGEAAGNTGIDRASNVERIDSVPLPPRLQPLVLAQQNRVAEVRAQVPIEKVSPSLWSRVRDRLRLVRGRRVGMVAGVALFSATIPTATDINSAQALSPEVTSYTAGTGEVAGVATGAVVDAAAILAYLRSTESLQPTVEPELLKPRQIDDIAPKQAVAPVEVVPGVIFNQEMNVSRPAPRFGFSPLADRGSGDPGIDLTPQVDESVPDQKLTLTWGDTFWDINEGQSIAGKLPVMSEINPKLKQALIAEVRSRLAKDPEMRKLIGGMGDTADMIYAGKTLNISELDKFVRIVAVEIGYLQ